MCNVLHESQEHPMPRRDSRIAITSCPQTFALAEHIMWGRLGAFTQRSAMLRALSLTLVAQR